MRTNSNNRLAREISTKSIFFTPRYIITSRSSVKLRSSRAALWCPILSVDAAGVAAAHGVVTVSGVTAATAPGAPSSESESSCALNGSRELWIFVGTGQGGQRLIYELMYERRPQAVQQVWK